MKPPKLLYGLCGGLLLLSGGLAYSYYKSSKENEDLKAKVERMAEENKKSDVVKRISQQMEDIAYQQKAISDKERENAELQTEIAQQQRIEAQQQSAIATQMRDRAEAEQRNAQKAAIQAKESEKKAQEQRAIAVEQRSQAEFAKRTTDTLSYISLARSMASQATTCHNAGNKKEEAALLAYGAWYFTDRYGGDPYYPAVFNALSLVSGDKKEYDFHEGGITRLLYVNSLVSFSNYGEVVKWDKKGDDVKPKELFFDRKYDFRDALAEGNYVYALSKDGSILRINPDKPADKLLMKFGTGKFNNLVSQGNEFVTADGTDIYIINKGNLTLSRTVKAPESISCISTYKGRTVLFTRKGKVYFLNKDDTIVHELTMGVGDICSFTYTPGKAMVAFGTESGMVYVMDYYPENKTWDTKMKNFKKIKGHKSKVSQVAFADGYLVTSGFDHTLKLWNLNATKLDPITLNSVSSWLTSFYFTRNHQIWSGDASGALTRIDASPGSMAKKIQKTLKRDLTQAEWNYYVGKAVPYTTFLNKN